MAQSNYTPYTFAPANVWGLPPMGSQDGPALGAGFFHPDSVVTDSNGNTFVADTENHTIRMISADGTTVLTFAGLAGNAGSTDGAGTAARFSNPAGLAIDSANNLYVSDSGNNTIRTITPAGVVTTLAGVAGSSGFADGTGSAARFDFPIGITTDPTGNLYVTDSGNNTVRKITAGGVVTTLAGVGMMPSAGSTDATGTNARFSQLYGVAVDHSGNIFVADTANDVIRMVTPAGVVTTVAGAAGFSGSADGVGTAARFFYPASVALGTDGSLLVADSSNNTIRKVSLPNGAVTTVAGYPEVSGSVDGIGASARFFHPTSLTVDGSGNIYVADTYNQTIRKIDSTGTVTTFAGVAGVQGYLDAVGTAARFYFPTGVAADSTGNIYEADASSEIIRKITPAGVVSTVAGLAGTSGTVDGTGTAARFRSPAGLAVDSSNNVYVADTNNCAIRMMTPAGVVTTVAGIPSFKGHADGIDNAHADSSHPAAQFNFPFGVAVDGVDNTIIVADTYNNAVRKISLSSQGNMVSTLAGAASNAGYADGAASTAQFNTPSGIAMDSKGNLYVADSGNNTIRKIDTSLNVTAYAGAGFVRISGSADGYAVSTARFNSPQGVAVDSSDNVWVADTGNDTVREISDNYTDANGKTVLGTSTPAGVALAPGRADGTGAVAHFQNPSGIWVAKGATSSSDVVYVADTGNHSIRKIVSGDIVTTLAGQDDNQGSVDGLGNAARFNNPSGIAADSSGNLYVADPGNSTIRKMTPTDSGFMVTTYAGVAGVIGSEDGTGTAVSMSNPWGVAVDPSGNVYVADSVNYNIRMITPGGVVSTPAGFAGVSGSTDGTGTAASFLQPLGVAVHQNSDGTTDVYIADNGNDTIRKMVMAAGTTTDGVVTTLAGTARVAGSLDGTGTIAEFYNPQSIAVDSTGNTLYVADTGNQAIRMLKLAPNASGTPVATVSTLAGIVGTRGHIDGPGTSAQFDQPLGLTIDPLNDNILYVADSFSDVIRQVTITTTNGTPSATVSTLAGVSSSPGHTDGPAATARFSIPHSVTVDSAGNVFVADFNNNTIREITPSGVVSTIAGAPSLASLTDADGPQMDARFSEPNGVAVDADGNIYVADTLDDCVRRIDTSGNVTTLAGVAETSGSGEGTGAAAQFFRPYGLAVDANKNVYVADSINATIRRIDPAGFVKTMAGAAGSRGSLDGTGSDASFYLPTALALDSANNIYVADTNNSTIRKITPSGSDGSIGVVTTLAGLAGFSGFLDGVGSEARFSGPNGIAVDAAGTVYVADTGTNTIRKITQSGVVTTLAGSSSNSGSIDGTGTDAWFSGPTGLAVDSERNVYVLDSSNQLIRRITPGGVVTTLAGTAGVVGYANGTGSDARFNSPNGIAVDSSGNLYVADTMNNLIRVGVPASGSGTGGTGGTGGSGGSGGTGGSGGSGGSGGTGGSGGSTGSSGGTNMDLSHAGSPNSSEGLFLFIFPTSAARDSSGNLIVADAANNTIDKVTPAGVVTALAGMAAVVGSTDANGTNALFNQPNGVTLDSTGNIFVADTGNGTIRRIASDGTVTTVAGSVSNRGNRDGAGTGAWFSAPTGIAADSGGNLYVADSFTDTIRKVTPSGTVTTVAGAPAIRGYADGTGTGARFNNPTGVAVDGAGNLYVADSYNDLVRKITSSGVVTTLAGDYNIAASLDGTGSNAYFNQPAGVTVDSVGNVYVADSGNCTIRKVTSDGVVTTVAGIGGLAGLLDGPGTNALFNQPKGLVLDGTGGLYVADSGNAAIRHIDVNATVSTPAMTQGQTTTTITTGRGSTGSGGTTTTSSSGGGGGAINPWFLGLLALMGVLRWLTRRK